MYYFSCLWLQHTDLLNAYRFFSPVGMVPVIALAGFGLFDRGFPEVGWGSSTENKDYCYPLYQWCCNLGQLTLITALCLCNFITGWTVCGNWCTNVHFICDLFSGMILFLTFNLTFFGPKMWTNFICLASQSSFTMTRIMKRVLFPNFSVICFLSVKC